MDLEALSRHRRFLDDYRRVRAREGWGSPSADYYRLLPKVAPADAQRATWSLRAIHFCVFIEKILRPLEQHRGRPLNILDLGAGNGWLANRLSERGHCVAAIDISDDAQDGLGAARHYPRPFLAIQADFDNLPLASGQADLVIFNGAFHYTSHAISSLQEALRMLSPAGQAIIMDSPVYTDPASGAAMVSERRREAARRDGVDLAASAGSGYITHRQLTELARSLSCAPALIHALPAWRRCARRIKAALTMRREPAGFPIVRIMPLPAWRPSLALRLARRVWEPYLRLRYRVWDQPHAQSMREVHICGRSVRVCPGVFDPRLFRSGEWFARRLSARLIPSGSSVLDLGTGTGVVAMVAAQWAAKVLAVDINPQAVDCARENMRRHQLQQLVEVRQSDLFDRLGQERFDVVLFNPPFLRGAPAGPLGCAFFSDDIAQRFAAGLRRHLAPGGYALLLLSSIGQTAEFLQALRWRCFRILTLAAGNWVAERFTLYKVSL